MKIFEITTALEEVAPLSLQESYDNAGLLIGSADQEVSKVLISLDITDAVLDEAITNHCELIIAHHPLIFKGIKKLNGSNLTERLVIKAIRNKLAIYAIHTNLDNVSQGVNKMLAGKLGLQNLQILSTGKSELKKLVTFCPVNHLEKVRAALFEAGAGHIGNYSDCSFNLAGTGSFKALDGSNPFVGSQGKMHLEDEIRIETIVPDYLIPGVIKVLIATHPYEEVAYDIYPLHSKNPLVGAGMIGTLKEEEDITAFLHKVKKTLSTPYLRHNPLVSQKVKKVAICGGSGSFLIEAAYRARADVFITGDIKYHDFFEYGGEMTIADAGHYETEQFTKDLIYDILKQKFPNFALQISGINTNPVKFL